MKVVFVASGVILAVLGIVGIVVGAILPNIVEDQITQGMKENLPRDVEDEEVVCPGSCEPSTKPNDIYVFNITNAKDVLENSETKPIVTQHKFSFTVHQTDYAMDYDAKTDSIGKRTLTRYVAKNEADYDTKFITINPVYVGAVAGQAGSEQGLLLGLVVPSVLSTLNGAVGQLGDAVAILLVGSYFQTVLGFCLTDPQTGQQDLTKSAGCIAAFNAGETKVDTVNAAIIPLMTGAKQNAVDAGAQYGANINPSVDGFSLSTNVSASFLELLVSNNPGVGLRSTDACALYLRAATAAAVSDIATVTSLYTAAKAIVPTLEFTEYTTVLTYFGKIVADPTFKLEVLAAVAIGGDVSALTAGVGLRWKEAVNTWDDLIFSQIGSGAVLGDKSLGLFAGQPNFEFFASQSPAALADRATITGVQAKLLFSEVSSDPGVVAVFCGELAAVQTGVITPTDFITKYAKYGVVDATTLGAMGNYLCKYLSTEYFANPVLAGGVLKADGTNAINGGLFVELTLREIMHGFDDPLYSALGQPQSYTGLLAQGEDNVTAAVAKDIADGNEGVKDRVVAGTKDNLDKIDYWVEAQGLKFIEKITDFKDGACPNTAVYSSGFASECKLWDEKEQIEGVADTRWPPLNEDTPVEDFEFYVHDLKRSVKVEKDEEEVELHKIRMVRYRILDSEDKRPEDVEGDVAKARANKYLPPMSGFIDLQRAQGMVPILIGFPRHSKASEAEAGKIVGLAKEHWEETEDDLTTYFDVEPLTGVMMGAHKRLQYNLLLKKSNFNAFPFYTNVTDDKMAFPILWLDDYNFISEEDAALVNEAIFDVRTQMKTVSLVAIIISVVNCVAGAALVLIGMKSDAAGELSNRS